MAERMSPSERIDRIEEALELLGEEVPASVRASVLARLGIARERAVLDPDTVLIALVGATGSGKSSLFNALVGDDVAVADVIRPTTSRPLAALGQGLEASALLDWLGVDRRVPLPAGAPIPERVVLLDLPDIDSRLEANREVARRIADRVDMVLWVVDPQKYADDVIHSQWIAPMARSARATAMILNHVDRLDDDARRAITGHLGALLAADGATDVPVIAVSARTGEGLASLRDVLGVVVRRVGVEAAKTRGELERAAAEIRSAALIPDHLPAFDAAGLADALAVETARSSGLDALAEDLGASLRHRANLALGWFPLKWLSALRTDPARSAHLGRRAGGHPGAPLLDLRADAAAMARTATGVRRIGEAIGEGRPPAWSAAMRERAAAAIEILPDSVDRAVARSGVGEREEPRWWRASAALQALAWSTALVGFGWILATRASSSALLLPLPMPQWRGLPVPTWLLLGGIQIGRASCRERV